MIDDYVAFGPMMLNRGKHGSGRVLCRHLVEIMTTDHVASEQKAASGFVSGYFDNHGWGSVCLWLLAAATWRARSECLAGMAAWVLPGMWTHGRRWSPF